MTRNQSKSNFIEQIRSDLSNTIDAILNHPYLYALEKKEISKVKLEIFVCEQYHIITNDKRNFAFTISKASSDVASKLFTDCCRDSFSFGFGKPSNSIRITNLSKNNCWLALIKKNDISYCFTS